MNSDFQKRLFRYQAKPPVKAWDAIAAALDEESPLFARRLSRYEVIPAAGVWSKISDRLGNAGTGIIRQLPFRKKWVGYAAAAVMIALAGFGIYLIVPANTNQPVAPAAVIPGTTTSRPVPSNETAAAQPAAADTVKEVAMAAPEIVAKNRNINRRLAARIPSVRRPQGVMNVAKNEVPLPEKSIVNASRADRYMIATAYDGTVVRLPKKAYAAFACVDMPPIACREKFASMQHKMAAASLTTDFAGFLDLLNNLQDQ